MKYRYCYGNGEVKEHTKLISTESINREKGNSKQVSIYKIHTVYQTEEREKYVTTLLLN